ncbi:MAG: DUF2442 domain-containing protein [Anaerolineae bacterium]|nr:MAG: DUF2442 domain-containing protein [Anaerolineae bacterium]
MNDQELSSQVIHQVVTYEIVDNYKIRLTFDDGTERTIDFEPILTGGVFGPLLDLELFNDVTLDKQFGTLVWPTGADIDPMVLYNWPDHVEDIINRRRRSSPLS